MPIRDTRTLWALEEERWIPLQHGKPHGAMYKKDLPQALAICEGIRAVNPKLILPGPSG